MHDQDARRAYWTQQMDAAYEFMQAILDYPVEERSEPMVSLPQAVTAAGLSVQFSQTKLAGSYDRFFYLREGLIESFINVAQALNDRGWTLKVEDAFRSTAMQKYVALHEAVLDVILQKVIWECRGQTPNPDLMFRRMTALCATFPKIGTHMSGTAIDVSVLRTDDLAEIDRGGPYLELSELTPMTSPFISADARQNRTEITELMHRQGFIAYPYEFWHYSKADAYTEHLANTRQPARYGPVDFDPATGRVTPIAKPRAPLHSLKDIKNHIDLALKRLKATPKT